MSKTISFSWSCSVTDRQRADGWLCRSMQCDRCNEFRENKDQAIIDMHLKEMEGRDPQGLEKTAPETYLKLKAQIQALQKENAELKEIARSLDAYQRSHHLDEIPCGIAYILDEHQATIDRLLGGEK